MWIRWKRTPRLHLEVFRVWNWERALSCSMIFRKTGIRFSASSQSYRLGIFEVFGDLCFRPRLYNYDGSRSTDYYEDM